MNSPFDELLATAIVGTERQPLKLPSGGALGGLLAQMDTTDREGALLSAAGVAAWHAQAGARLAHDLQPAPAVCQADAAPRCNSQAAQHLGQMLEGSHKEVLPEWLRALAAAGQRVPEEHLPALLDRGNADKSLRELILPVIGHRGRWLAGQNPAWCYAAERDSAEVWANGKHHERLSLLQRLRVSEPEKARELLASTWQTEVASEKVKFLEALKSGLSLADEPFLVAALSERGQEVKRAAADLLAHLEDSGLCRWAAEMSVSALSLTAQGCVKVSLPTAWEDSLSYQGVAVNLSPAWPWEDNLGLQAQQLAQLLGAVKLSMWEQRFGVRPKDLLLAARKSDWRTALWQGWEAATQRQQNEDWAEAFLRVAAEEKKDWEKKSNVAWRVIPALSALRLERLIEDLSQEISVPWHDGHPAAVLLRDHQTLWSKHFSGIAGNSFKAAVVVYAPHRAWKLYHLLEEAACYLNTELHAELNEGWAEEADGWSALLERFRAILQFRREMLKAITS